MRSKPRSHFFALLPNRIAPHGIGEVTAAKMHSLGIHTGADLKERSLTDLTHHFGKAGYYYYKIAIAEDDRPVEANRVRKSIGCCWRNIS